MKRGKKHAKKGKKKIEDDPSDSEEDLPRKFKIGFRICDYFSRGVSYALYIVVVPLLIGYLLNMGMETFERFYKYKTGETEWVEFFLLDEKLNHTYHVPLSCNYEFEGSNDIRPFYLLGGDLYSSHLSFPISQMIENKINFCVFARKLKGQNWVKKYYRPKAPKTLELSTKEIIENHYENFLEAIVEYAFIKNQNKSIILLGHGFGANFIYHHPHNTTMVKKKILLNPIPIHEKRIFKYFSNLGFYGLFSGLTGLSRIFTLFVNYIHLIGISKKNILAHASFCDDSKWWYKQLVLPRQAVYDGAREEIKFINELNMTFPLSENDERKERNELECDLEVFYSKEFVGIEEWSGVIEGENGNVIASDHNEILKKFY